MKATRRDPDPGIAQILNSDASPARRNRFWRWLIPVVLAAGAAVALHLVHRTAMPDTARFRTETARSGVLIVTVTATGSLEPTNEVEVGSELSGIVKRVEADFNDRVTVGQVLARLDTSKLEAEVMKSKAALASARAKVMEIRATVTETRDELERLQRAWKLSDGKLPSQQELDAAKASYERARAEQASAEAQVSEALATLDANKTDLSKTVIYSPINGVVLDRSVEPGQTVAASLQAPVLFTLAEDLTQMELHVDVDEADVGQVKQGQEAVFTVDAYPNRSFPAHITQVRYGSQTVDGVVTYETVLNVDNSDLSLRPGMTATADITVKKIENAVLIPNAALRFTPPESDTKVSPDSGGGILGKLLPHPPGRASSQEEAGKADTDQQHVYTLQGERLVAVPIAIGSSDGVMTEVITGNIAPGTVLVVDVLEPGQ